MTIGVFTADPPQPITYDRIRLKTAGYGMSEMSGRDLKTARYNGASILTKARAAFMEIRQSVQRRRKKTEKKKKKKKVVTGARPS